MNRRRYSEDRSVQKPAAELLAICVQELWLEGGPAPIRPDLLCFVNGLPLDQRVKERIDTLAAEGELTDEQEEKLYKELNTEGFVLTLPSRLQKVADDFVRHFSDRWRMMNGLNKALMVCLDKRTCVQMHGLIAAAWNKRARELHDAALAEMARYAALGKAPDEFLLDQQRKVAWMRETEMCVVVSQSPTERKDFDGWGPACSRACALPSLLSPRNATRDWEMPT